MAAPSLQDWLASFVAEHGGVAGTVHVRERGGADFGFAFADAARFRVSVFKERGNFGCVLRQIPNKLLTMEQIGIPPSTWIAKPPEKPRQSPICFYGTSIVQGACASRPGMSYPAILGRRLGRA